MLNRDPHHDGLPDTIVHDEVVPAFHFRDAATKRTRLSQLKNASSTATI
jgi:hypothetical protein